MPTKGPNVAQSEPASNAGLDARLEWITKWIGNGKRPVSCAPQISSRMLKATPSRSETIRSSRRSEWARSERLSSPNLTHRAALGPSPRSLHQVKLARNERGHEVAVKILNKKKVDAMNMTRKVPLRHFIAADCRISLPRMGHALGR